MSKFLSPIPAIYPVYDKRVSCENWIGIGFSLGGVSMGVKMCQKVGTVVSAPAPHAGPSRVRVRVCLAQSF